MADPIISFNNAIDKQNYAIESAKLTQEQLQKIIILGEDSQETNHQLEELRQKIDSATEQILAGNVTDGELVFEQLKTRLREEYGLE